MVGQKAQSETDPSVSTSFTFLATDEMPDLPSLDKGLESISISVGEGIQISVTIGSRKKAEAANRMRNSRITPIGGHSSVQTIAQDPTDALPNNIRRLL